MILNHNFMRAPIRSNVLRMFWKERFLNCVLKAINVQAFISKCFSIHFMRAPYESSALYELSHLCELLWELSDWYTKKCEYSLSFCFILRVPLRTRLGIYISNETKFCSSVSLALYMSFLWYVSFYVLSCKLGWI